MRAQRWGFGGWGLRVWGWGEAVGGGEDDEPEAKGCD